MEGGSGRGREESGGERRSRSRTNADGRSSSPNNNGNENDGRSSRPRSRSRSRSRSRIDTISLSATSTPSLSLPKDMVSEIEAVSDSFPVDVEEILQDLIDETLRQASEEILQGVVDESLREVSKEVLEGARELNEEYVRPADTRAVQQLPRKEHLRIDNSSCSICLERFGLGEGARVMQCGHIYHMPCLFRWLGTRNTCPLCRL